MQYVASVDQGTTSTRCILFDTNGRQVCLHNLRHTTHRSQAGWEEHDPIEILENVKKCIDTVIDMASIGHSIDVSQVKAIGITNQRETTVIWDRNTGLPLYNAIVWQDLRTQSTVEVLRQQCGEDRVRKITGLPISTYFSGVKVRWLIDNSAAVREGIKNGTALFGTIDSWLVWKLSVEKTHATDVTNAGRTMMMNIRSLSWDDEMLNLIGIKRDILPEIKSSSEFYGTLACTKLEGKPISGVIGDQQAALVGQSCFEKGEAKSTYGTGCFLIVNTGTEVKFSRNGLLTTPAYKLGKDDCVYSLEGSIAVAGSGIEWLQNSLNLIRSAAESEEVARRVPNTGGVYFVPAFTGLFAPWWRADARGTIVGMTQFTTREHVARALLESIAFQVNDVLSAVSEDMHQPISELKVDGGVSNNNLIMQMQADITNTRVLRPEVIETTALGAAFCAGHAVGLFQSFEEFRETWALDRAFETAITAEEHNEKLRMWNSAVRVSLGWAGDDADNGVRSRIGQFFTKPGVLTGLVAGLAVASYKIVSLCRRK